MAAVLVLGCLVPLGLGAPGATVAEAKKGGVKAAPGQVKKALPEPAPQAVLPAPVEQTAKAVKAPKVPGAAKPQNVPVAKAPKVPNAPKAQDVTKPHKAPKPFKGRPPAATSAAPSKAADPQPVAQPTPSASSAPAASSATSPAVPPAAQPAPEAEATPAARTSGQQRLGAADRRHGRRAASERGGRATRATAVDGAFGIADTGPDGGPLAGLADVTPASAERDDEPTTAEPESSPVIRTVRDIVEVVPDSVKLALAALAALSLLLAGAYGFSVLRVRSLARQRGELLSDVGLLQSALLPPVPDRVGALDTSVAYRPADGLGAGGDFYDVLPLSGGRAGFILGDVSGHGRDALERTAFLRYTLRAYLEAGLEPRVALQVAGRVIGDGLGGDFATVLLAVHDPRRGALTYASAGHPAPIVAGGPGFEPVLAGSSPPIGTGLRTGLRQTSLPLTPGAVACLYTDGLIEARTHDGLLGRERLTRILAGLGRDATAGAVIERVAEEARSVADDMAVCLLSPTATVTSGGFRTEQLELSAEEAAGPLPGRFLEECGVGDDARDDAERELREVAERYDGAVLHATFGSRRTVEVLPRNVESIEVASRQAVAV